MEQATVLVTGGTAGIGLATATVLATQGAQVLVTGRNRQRGDAAVVALRRQAGHGRVHFLAADHATVGGNHTLARQVLAGFGRLDVLVNNVGGLPHAQRQQTADGYEAGLAVNFIGPAAVTAVLLPLLRASAPARVVNVVSSAYRMWKRDPFEDLQAQQGYVGITAHGHAKLLNLLWTLALARRLDGAGVVVNATNPGMAWTPGTQALTRDAVPAWRLIWPLVRSMQRRASPASAARSSIFLASSEAAGSITGQFFESNAKPKRPTAVVLDVANQERAYALAARLAAEAPTASKASRP